MADGAYGAAMAHAQMDIIPEADASALLVVVGLSREARVVRGGARVLIGGRGLAPALAEPPAALLSFGLCGGLDPALQVGDMVLGESVTTADGCYTADPDWTRQLALAVPGARLTGIAAGDEIAASRATKAALRASTGAGAVDMESHLVAATAARLGVPFAVLRSVSDRADHAISHAAQAGFTAHGRPDVGAVLMALMARPMELPSLIRTAIHAATAFRALELCGATLDWRAPLAMAA
jgi:hopanoid-associated phosphorylase